MANEQENNLTLTEQAPIQGVDENAKNNDVDSIKSLGTAEELDIIRKRMAEMEEETARLQNIHEDVKEGVMFLTEQEKAEVDARSIYVGNVDYSVTPEQLQDHFKSCGTINRVTIICDKGTGHPKGYGYVEFSDPSLVANALVLNDSVLNQRNIKVLNKRTNIPGMVHPRGRGGRGRVSRGRGRGRGEYRGRRPNYNAHYTPY